MAKTRKQRMAAKARRAAQADLVQDDEAHAERRRIRQQEDPRKVVIEARARLMGGRILGDALLPFYEHPCGQAIAAKAKDKDEALALWSVFDPMDRADHAYCRHVLGRARFAKTARLELLPEPFEAREDQKPDLRSEDDKHRDASDTWARWRGHMAALTRGERRVILHILRGLSEPMRDGAVTVDGLRFVRAMRSLRDEINRQT